MLLYFSGRLSLLQGNVDEVILCLYLYVHMYIAIIKVMTCMEKHMGIKLDKFDYEKPQQFLTLNLILYKNTA